MTQANEPCRQEGEGARRRQWRGSDIRGTCLSTSPVSGVSPEPGSTSRSSHSGTSESAWLQELRSPPQHRCRRPFRRGATRAVLTWATVPWRRAHERREVGRVRPCPRRMLSQGRGGRRSCTGWSRGRRRETETGRGDAQRRAPHPLEAVGGEAGKVSNRAATEPGTRAACSSRPPRPAGIPFRRRRHCGGRSAGLSRFSEPERLPEPAIPATASGHPGGRPAGILLAWSVGPAGLGVSRDRGKRGPCSQDEKGCGPSTTPAPLPTWRPRPRGVSVYADGRGPVNEAPAANQHGRRAGPQE